MISRKMDSDIILFIELLAGYDDLSGNFGALIHLMADLPVPSMPLLSKEKWVSLIEISTVQGT